MPSALTRHDIEFLVDEGGLDLIVTQWPLPRSAVRQAVEKMPATLSAPLQTVRDRVLRALASEAQSRASLSLQTRDDGLAGFGDDATRGSWLAVRSATVDGGAVSAQVGIRVESISGLDEDRKLRLDDTALATELYGVQLQAWSHRDWWGPGWQSSLVLSNNAPALNGVGIQRAAASRSESPWFSWLGPWNYEIFIAQTEDVARPANPYFFGQRLTFKPFSNLELALTRTAQWGGRRRQQTAKSFLHMLVGTGVNADRADQQAVDPANEMAGFDMRLRCPGNVPCAAYLQAIGEDQAGVLPSRYLGLYGVETWSADGRQRYYAEYAETGCRSPVGRPFLRDCAYRNFAYPQGYADAGRWLGASVGPDSRLFAFGWLDAERGTSVRVNVGSVGSRIGTFTPEVIDPQTSGRLFGVSAKQVFQWDSVTVTPALAWTRIGAPNGRVDDLRIGATLQMSLDPAFATVSGGLGTSLSGTASAWRPLWVGAGLVAASALLDRPTDHYVRDHAQNFSGRALGRIGSSIPLGAFGLAGLSWALQRGSAQGEVAFAALEAGVSAAVVSEMGKFVVDRSRPLAGQGAGRFGDVSRSQSAFPSVHTAVAWAVLTPYAKYYDAPWLYGLAALTNVGRVAEREHWLSDTVAGAAIGYFVGDFFYRRSDAASDPAGIKLWITPRAIRVEKSF